MRFSQRVYAERKKNGLSADQLAKACEVSRSYITLIENGRRLPGSRLLPKLAAAFSLSTAVLVDWYLEDMRAKIQHELGIES